MTFWLTPPGKETWLAEILTEKKKIMEWVAEAGSYKYQSESMTSYRNEAVFLPIFSLFVLNILNNFCWTLSLQVFIYPAAYFDGLWQNLWSN